MGSPAAMKNVLHIHVHNLKILYMLNINTTVECDIPNIVLIFINLKNDMYLFSLNIDVCSLNNELECTGENKTDTKLDRSEILESE